MKGRGKHSRARPRQGKGRTGSAVRKNKKGRSKGKRGPNRWTQAVAEARRRLGITGFMAVKRGSKLHQEATRIMKES